MAHQPVWTGVDDPMAFLSRDLVRPKTSEMNPSPPGEQEPCHHKNRQHVDPAIAEVPERAFGQELRDPRCEQESSNNNWKPWSACAPVHRPLRCGCRPERSRDPADKPADPDEGKQLGRPGGQPPAPDRVKELTETKHHACRRGNLWFRAERIQ